MIDTSNIKLCFYTPADGTRTVPSIIDVARTNDKGETVTYFHGETLEALKARYPNAQLGTIEEVTQIKERALRSDPVQITEDQYFYALECLPPLDWQVRGGGESFKMVERYSGRMTNIYAKLGNTYWQLMDVDTLPHAEIMAKVSEAARKEATV